MARYGKKAQQKVKEAMHERKRGTLKSGRSGKKATNRKQAIAIGLSKARKAGAQVPPTAAAASVSGIPGAIVAALLIGVAKLNLSSAVGIARIVAAGVIHRVGIRASVRLRPGQDVMRIRHIADAVHDPCLFRQRE